MLQARHGTVHSILNILRQRTGHAAQIHLIGIESFRLNENLVTGLIREFHNLILNGRTVTRTGSLNRPGKQRRTVQIIADDLVGLLIRVSQPAGNLFLLYRLRIRRKRERHYALIAELLFHLGKVNAPAVHTRRCSGLKTEHLNSICNQRIRQMICRLQPIRAGCVAHISVNAARLQVSSSCQHDRLRMVDSTGIRFYTCDLMVFHNDL